MLHYQNFYEPDGTRHVVTIDIDWRNGRRHYDVRVDGALTKTADCKSEAFDEVVGLIRYDHWTPIRRED